VILRMRVVIPPVFAAKAHYGFSRQNRHFFRDLMNFPLFLIPFRPFGTT
jgi:hypothetical protein